MTVCDSFRLSAEGVAEILESWPSGYLARAIIQSSGTVFPTPQNIAREAAKQSKHEIKSKPKTPANVTVSHDHLPDTPLNDS